VFSSHNKPAPASLNQPRNQLANRPKVVETIQDRVGQESFIISIGDLDPVRAAGGSLAWPAAAAKLRTTSGSLAYS